jgi:predicted  nucleic acid-binding Zn-ribbon protein
MKNYFVRLFETFTQKYHEENHHLNHVLKEISMKLSDVLSANVSIRDQLTKVEVEIVKRVADLQAAIDALTQQLADVELTPEQVASFDELKAAAQGLDDLNADEIVPEPVPEFPPE